MRFSHELFPALLLVSNDPIGVAVTSARSKRSKISVAALNFGAEFAANASPNRTGRTQLTPLLGLGPNNDPGLAGETGLSRD
jgi:hypothetical protein